MNLRAKLSQPAFRLGLIAGLVSLLVQPGELGSVDTERRLQTTHSFWTSAPAVKDGDYPEFGLIGRGGKVYTWYGLGQSLVMLPADIVATVITDVVPRLRRYDGFRSLFVSYVTSPLIAVLAILAYFRFLLLLRFTTGQAFLGGLALLLGTTFLHYCQNMMENNLILLLAIIGFCSHYQWLQTGRIRPLILGSIALGANLLIRITTALDLLACAFFVLLCVLFQRMPIRRYFSYCLVCGPLYAAFFIVDRLYHFARFGTWQGTYIHILAEQQRRLVPNTPADFPFHNPFWDGFLGPFIKPEKSIFLFDPLLILTLILVLVAWRHLRKDVRAYVISLSTLLIAYAVFYARIQWHVGPTPTTFIDWAGDVAWGDRYITSPVHLLAAISVPLVIRHGLSLGRGLRLAAVMVIALSFATQAASVILWYPLEFAQMRTRTGPTYVVGLRAANLIAPVIGKTEAWALNNQYTLQPEFQVRRPYFYPFTISKLGIAPRSVAVLAIATWVAALLVLMYVVWTSVREFQNEGAISPSRRESVPARQFDVAPRIAST